MTVACLAERMRENSNKWIGVNYLDLNSKMAVPPAYWLARLFDFDADLVVFPSFHMPYAYVLARRARKSRGIDGAKAIVDTCGQPDTVACLQHGLVPVTMILRTGGGWSIDNILESLRRRDLWRFKNSDAAADQLDQRDENEQKRVRQQTRETMWNLSGDAWRSYQARTGASSIKFNDRHPSKSGTGAPTTNSSSSSTVTAGQ